MAEKVELKTGKSQEEIALELFKMIADVEGKTVHSTGPNSTSEKADRKYIIETYVACARAVKLHATS